MFYYNTLKELEDLVNENKLEVWQVIEQSVWKKTEGLKSSPTKKC